MACIPVTFAPIAFAKLMPLIMACSDNEEPSVGIKICVYMLELHELNANQVKIVLA
jgi:hypothetical protein